VKNSFKNLTYQELKAKREELKKKYMDLRLQMVIGHVDNPLQKRTMRRQIARLHTLIHAHDLAEIKAAAIKAVQQIQRSTSGSTSEAQGIENAKGAESAPSAGAEAK
jgi:large subunit ribosomal protein L29